MRYTEKSVIGRLLTIFSSLFRSATRSTRHLLTWFLMGQLTLELAPLVRCLYRHLLSKQTDTSLSMCSYVTLSKSGSRRLFFSTVAPMAPHMSVA